MAKKVSEKTKAGNGSDQKNARVAIIVSKFNEYLTKRLLNGCLDELNKLGVNQKNITVTWVPGAYEIPLIAQKYAKRNNIDAVICLGAIVRGQTKHYDLVAEGAERGIMEVMLKTGKPLVFEILAADTMALVEARAQEKGENKGRDAAQTAIEMINICKKIEARKTS